MTAEAAKSPEAEKTFKEGMTLFRSGYYGKAVAKLQEAVEQIEALREERQEIRSKVSRMLEMMAGLEEGASGEARLEH